MRRIEVVVFLGCALLLGGWMSLGPERYVHRSELVAAFNRG